MNRKPVISSNISSIGYDENSQILEIEFSSGALYQYQNVPLSIYNGLMSATSHGQYFDAWVRKGGYSFIRVR